MQPVAFCNRCRGIKVGWNRRYLTHCLVCRKWLAKSFKTTVLTGFFSSFVFVFPTAVAPALPGVSVTPAVAFANAAALRAEKTAAVEKMLTKHGADKDRLPRVVRAIMASSSRHGVDPRLVASIMIVESNADPYAVSEADSVGLMQIHLGTWGTIADEQNVNLFKVEDNVEFGVRILRDYIKASDTWEGVARYRGKTDAPESQRAALEYVQKVQRIYGFIPKR
jgi:soluble lytic murein transglycosylase-like protein